MNLRRHIVNMALASMDNCSDMNPLSNTNIVVGLNGALQKRFILPENHGLVPGNVHRATNVAFGVGGKGQDVAIALNCLVEGGGLFSDNNTNENQADSDITTPRSDNNIRLVQFIGNGFAGDIVYNLLKDRLGEKTMQCTVRTSSEMRTCTSIISFKETTELVEPSGSIRSDESDEILSVISNNRSVEKGCRKDEAARSLCIMGSMPPGCPNNIYARIYAQVAGPNTVCVVDSLAGIHPLLETVSKMGKRSEKNVTVGPLLFKINASELCKLAETPKNNNDVGGITLIELTNAIEAFLKKYSITSNEHSTSGVIGLAVTDGSHDAYFVSIKRNKNQENLSLSLLSFGILKLPVPNLNDDSTHTLFPIGAGDAVAAGTVGAWTSLAVNDVKVTSSLSYPAVIPEDSLDSLVDFAESISKHCSENSLELNVVQAQAVASFAFGLACGSASCLQEQNSVVRIGDVNTLLQAIMTRLPEIILTSSTMDQKKSST